MANAYMIGLLYAVFGVVLLFFGARFMKVVLAVLGGYIGINVGQLVVNLFNFNGAWAFMVIAATAVVLAYLAVSFYKLFVAAAAALMLGQLTQAVAVLFGVSSLWAAVLAFMVGVGSFILIRRLDIVEILFKFITSVHGATALVSGLLVILDSSRVQALQTNNYDSLLGASSWWAVIWIILFSIGIGYQLRTHTEEPATA